jgi:hypothetical protein
MDHPTMNTWGVEDMVNYLQTKHGEPMFVDDALVF